MIRKNNSPAIFAIGVALLFSCARDPQIKEVVWPTDINYAYVASERINRILEHKPDKTKYAMLGNSITELGQDWNKWLDRNDVINSGQGGYTTQQFTWLLDSCVLASKPEYCFIMGGINDLSLGIPVSRIFSNYKYILSTLKKHHIHAIVQSTLYQAGNSENNPKVTELNGLLIAWCNEHNIPFIDLNVEMSDETGLKKDLTTDGTHLTDAGYTVWSGILKIFIAKLENKS